MRVTIFWTMLLLAPALRAQEVDPSATTLFQSALEYYRAGEMDRAIENFLKAYQADGAILSINDEGLIDGVINYLQGTIQKAPDNADAHYKLGDFLNLSGRLAESVTHYEQVVKLSPTSPLGQSADGEAKKLKAIIAAQKAAAPPPEEDEEEKEPEEKDPAEDEEESEDEVTEPEVDPLDYEKSQTEAKSFKAQLEQMKVENGQLKADHNKLKQEFEAYKKEAEEWKKYRNIFFSNPANIEALKQGKIR